MLRLRPTALSVTMTEVNTFELHQRYKSYLAKNASFAARPDVQNRIWGATMAPSEGIAASHSEPNWVTHHSGAEHNSLGDQEDMAVSHQRSPIPFLSSPTKAIDWGASNGSTDSSSEDEQTSTAFLAIRRHSKDLPLEELGEPPVGSVKGDVWRSPPAPSSDSDVTTDQNGELAMSSSLSSTPLFANTEGTPHDDRERPTTRQRSRSAASVRSGTEEGSRRRHDSFRIYNDALPAVQQPQTPRNLPEARHQSRIRGSHTAPRPARIHVEQGRPQ